MVKYKVVDVTVDIEYRLENKVTAINDHEEERMAQFKSIITKN